MGEFLAIFHDNFRDDLRFWVKTDRKTAMKVLELVETIVRDPFKGTGKPEPLKHHLAGVWSRRITQEHRLVYRVKDQQVIFLSCRFHYER